MARKGTSSEVPFFFLASAFFVSRNGRSCIFPADFGGRWDQTPTGRATLGHLADRDIVGGLTDSLTIMEVCGFL